MKKINDLPPEILRKCFRFLSPPDLKSSVMVSEYWRAVGEDPSLWTWCQVTIRNREDLNKLSVRRLRKVKKIRILSVRCWDADDWEAGDWEALWQVVASEELPQLEEVELSWTHLRTEQINSIVTRIAQEDIKLKKLNLKEKDLSDVEPEALARAVVELEEVDLGSTDLSTEQITSILTTIAQEDIKLKKLDLQGNDFFLLDVEPEVIARGLIKLEEVNLDLTKLRTEQITSILTRIAEEDINLKKLNLIANDLSDVEPEVVARSLTKLEEVDLGSTKLSTEQMTSILITIDEEDIKLKKLYLHGIDLSYVEPEVLARSLIKLEEVNLCFTHLWTEQITSILTIIAREDTKLKKLNLYGNDLSNVEPEVLVRAVVKLDEVDLGSTKLSTEQMTSFLTTIAEEDIKLKKLYLHGIGLSDVEPEVLARGLIKLEEVDYGFTHLGENFLMTRNFCDLFSMMYVRKPGKAKID